MKLEFDTQREEEIFRSILKDADLNEMRPELKTEGSQLIQKMADYNFDIKPEVCHSCLSCERCGCKITRKKPMIPICLKCIKEINPELLIDGNKEL